MKSVIASVPAVTPAQIRSRDVSRWAAKMEVWFGVGLGVGWVESVWLRHYRKHRKGANGEGWDDFGQVKS